MTRDETLKQCAEAEVPCGSVFGIDEIFEDPHYKARGNILMVKDERVGELAIPNIVPRLLGTPGQVTSLGPTLGSHTDQVLRELLGYGSEQITALRERGAI